MLPLLLSASLPLQHFHVVQCDRAATAPPLSFTPAVLIYTEACPAFFQGKTPGNSINMKVDGLCHLIAVWLKEMFGPAVA